VPTKLFNKYSGFDKHYTPAYCEDLDLALKIRNDGYRVLYQPLSKVVHYEGITSGTDLTQGAKSYQVANMQKVFVRWQDLLKNYQDPGVDVDSAKDRMATKRALFVDDEISNQSEGNGEKSRADFMVQLRELGFQVTYVPANQLNTSSDSREKMQKLGIEVLYAPYTSTLKAHLEELGSRYDLVVFAGKHLSEENSLAIRSICLKAKLLSFQIGVSRPKDTNNLRSIAGLNFDGHLNVIESSETALPEFILSGHNTSFRALSKDNDNEVIDDLTVILGSLGIDVKHISIELDT